MESVTVSVVWLMPHEIVTFRPKSAVPFSSVSKPSTMKLSSTYTFVLEALSDKMVLVNPDLTLTCTVELIDLLRILLEERIHFRYRLQLITHINSVMGGYVLEQSVQSSEERLGFIPQ